MWWRRRRIQALEDAISLVRADQAELRRRLELFEQIARAAGATLPEMTTSSNAVPAAPLPASLVAAAHADRQRQVPVRLDVDGTDVIAVIWGPGDPREWWSAVTQAIDKGGRSVIRLGRLPLPAGLSAVVWPGRNDDLAIVVSEVLDPARQREAARVALRAARSSGGRLGLLPLPAALLLSSVRHAIAHLVRPLRLHAFATAVAGAASAAALTAVVITLAPHSHVHPTAARPRPPSNQQPPASRQPTAARSKHHAVRRSGDARHAKQTAPGAVTVVSRGPGRVPSPSPSASNPPTPRPSPAPIPSSTPPAPTPTPSAAPTTSSSPSPEPTICVEILGVEVCI